MTQIIRVRSERVQWRTGILAQRAENLAQIEPGAAIVEDPRLSVLRRCAVGKYRRSLEFEAYFRIGIAFAALGTLEKACSCGRI